MQTLGSLNRIDIGRIRLRYRFNLTQLIERYLEVSTPTSRSTRAAIMSGRNDEFSLANGPIPAVAARWVGFVLSKSEITVNTMERHGMECLTGEYCCRSRGPQ